MNKKTWNRRLGLAGLAFIILMSSASNAFAWGGWRRDLPARHEVVTVGRAKYHYHDGRFYRPGFFNFGFFISVPPIGAVIKVIPAGCRTIVVGRRNYYYYDNIYYTTTPGGYVVVPAPVVTTTPAVVAPTMEGETITINVPNSNGSYTPVRLVKQGNGYIGPQGEYYPGNPSVEQLKALYGK